MNLYWLATRVVAVFVTFIFLATDIIVLSDSIVWLNKLGVNVGTVKPVLRGQPRGHEKNWLLKTGDPLIQAHLHCIWVQETLKKWRLKTGDPLVQ